MRINQEHIQKLLKHTIGNKGASLRLIDNKVLGSELKLDKGYMVGNIDIIHVKSKDLTLTDMVTICNNRVVGLTYDKEHFLGSWYDESGFYIDLSLHILDKDEAIKEGKRNKQKAIYDIASGESIYL